MYVKSAIDRKLLDKASVLYRGVAAIAWLLVLNYAMYICTGCTMS